MIPLTRNLSFAFSVALIVATSLTQAHTEDTPPTAMKMAMKPGPALAATATFDAESTLWAVRSEAGHVLLQSSTDAGSHWSAARHVNAMPEDIAADGDGAPKLALGPQGELYFIWTTPLSKPYSGAVRFVRSLDRGKTFSPPLTVHADRQEITHRFDALAVTGSGQIVVAWIDKRDLEQAKKNATDYRGAAVYFRDHALARFSTDGTVKEFRRATFDEWHVDGCPHHGPAVARDGRGRLHAVWFTGAEGNAGVYYGRLVDGAVAAQRKVGAGTAAHADLAVTGRRVALAWKEFDGQQTQLFGEVSDDGGERWRRIALAQTDGPSDHPRLLVRGNEFYVLWNTEKEPMRVVALK